MNERTEAELLEASLERVWNEHDDTRRLIAIGELYHPNACIYEPKGPTTGHQAISDVVAGVLADMPAGFRFRVIGSSLGHHGMAVTQWEGGPPGKVIVSGADAARVVDGQLHEHWFFFNPSADA